MNVPIWKLGVAKARRLVPYLISTVAALILACKQQVGSQTSFGQACGLDSLARARWSLVRGLEDAFQQVQVAQLSTGPDHLIGVVTSMCILNNSDMVIADGMMTRSVLLFDRNGNFKRSIGAQGQGPGEYLYPKATAIAGDSLIYVYDGDLLRLTVFTTEGKYRQMLQIGRYHDQLRVDAGGNLLFYTSSISDASGTPGPTVFKYAPTGKLLQRFASQSKNFVGSGPSTGGGIAVDEHGMIYHITPYEYRISQYAGDGKLVKTFSRDAPFYKAPPPTSVNLQLDHVALARWHSSWTHIMGITLLHGNILIVVMQDLPTRRNLLEFYDAAGHFLAGEIDLPSGTSATVASRDDELYLLRYPEQPDAGGNVPNPKVVRYRLKSDLKG